MKRQMSPKMTFVIVAVVVIVAAFFFWKAAAGKEKFVPRGGAGRTPKQSWEVTAERGQLPTGGRGIYRQQAGQREQQAPAPQRQPGR